MLHFLKSKKDIEMFDHDQFSVPHHAELFTEHAPYASTPYSTSEKTMNHLKQRKDVNW